MKVMLLLSLRASLHSNITLCVCQFHDEVCDLEERVGHIEAKMEQFALSFNALLDSHNDREDNIAWL